MDKLDKNELIEEIVKLEWEAFDKVHNEGGRAYCQDNYKTFSIMRKSQYMTWTEELLRSYINDFKNANLIGRNLIEEKYGRMMESTAPDEYAKIKEYFPTLSEQRIKLQEQIISIQVQWMEEFSAVYRKMAENARIIHTYEDTQDDTSYETYLRGEISTYSEDTIKLYAAFIINLARRGENLAGLTIGNTAKLYGFESLEEAERFLSSVN